MTEWPPNHEPVNILYNIMRSISKENPKLGNILEDWINDFVLEIGTQYIQSTNYSSCYIDADEAWKYKKRRISSEMGEKLFEECVIRYIDENPDERRTIFRIFAIKSLPFQKDIKNE